MENIEIVKVAAEGKSLGYADEKVIFVPNTVPGDIVDVQITRKRKNFMEGYVAGFRKFSELRVVPPCIHFGICGGCKWQHLPYAKQLEYKQREVIDNLERLGKIELKGIRPIIGAEKIFRYRNKLEFTFSEKRYLSPEEIAEGVSIERGPALGFHVPGLFDKVVDISQCHLQEAPSNEIRNFIRDYAMAHGLSFHNIRNKTGFLRTLVIRISETGDIMVILAFHHEEREKREALLDALLREFPSITSLMYVINPKANDTLADLDILPYKSGDCIYETMEDLKFRIGPKSFYQTNSAQALRLYSSVREMAGLKGGETVYDLYTGTGTIANFIARSAAKVVGIEYVEDAVKDARTNSKINGISNTVFYAGDMKEVLNEEFIRLNGRPDLVITDPPRAGMHEDVVKAVIAAAPEKIIYVSCNSATQARDVAMMKAEYAVVSVQPVDMFPHTHHVENILCLEKRQA